MSDSRMTNEEIEAEVCRLIGERDKLAPHAADLAAFADLLAWQAAGKGRELSVATLGGTVYVTIREDHVRRALARHAFTTREAIRSALAAWGEG